MWGGQAETRGAACPGREPLRGRGWPAGPFGLKPWGAAEGKPPESFQNARSGEAQVLGCSSRLGSARRHAPNLVRPCALSAQQGTEPVSAPRPRGGVGRGWMGGRQGRWENGVWRRLGARGHRMRSQLRLCLWDTHVVKSR